MEVHLLIFLLIFSVRYQVSSARPINYSEEASRLVGLINSYDTD